MKLAFHFLLIALLFVGCAQTGPPPGGPEDRTPPEIIETYPEHGSTNVDTSTTIVLRFDESVKQASLRSAFGLSPPPPGTVRADWSGKKVELRFEPALLPDRTYALTIGTQLTDDHNNELTDTYVLAFSTGDSLDTGRLSGSLLTDDKPAGWNVAGYFIDDSTSVPDPSSDPPDATTQTGQDGSWNLTNLREGWWRVFAFKDVDGDRLWTPWMDQLAVPAYDVEAVSAGGSAPRELILRPSDPIVLPQPLRVTAVLKDQFLIRMDRKPHRLEVEYTLDSLPPPAEGETYPEEWVLDEEDLAIPVFSQGYRPGDSTIVMAGLEQPVNGDAIGLRIHGSFGTEEMLDTTMAVDLTTAVVEDTLQPTLVSVEPEDRAKMHRGKNEIWFTFSEPIRLVDTTGIVLYGSIPDTMFPDVSRPYPNRLTFSVDPETEGGGLSVDLFGASIVDLAGNTLRDSLLTYKYAWLPADSLGLMSGTVTTPDSVGAVHLRFRELNDKQQPLQLTLPGGGDFQVIDIPAGRWQVQGWQDVSQSLQWFAGTAVPFQPSDPVYASRDTLIVRARWETGGLEIIFP